MEYINNNIKFQIDILGLFSKLRKKHGDIVKFQIGRRSFYLVTHPRFAKQILLDQSDVFLKLSQLSGIDAGLSIILGNGLTQSYGPTWKRQRKIIQPIFNKKNVESYASLISQSADIMLRDWDCRCNSGPLSIDVFSEMSKVTMQIICQTMFGEEVYDRTKDLSILLGQNIRFASNRVLKLLKFPLDWPIYSHVKFRKNEKILDDFIFNIIKGRMESRQNADDMLGRMLREDQQIDYQQLRDEVMTIFLAGHETTANALTWTLFNIFTHPEAYEKIAKEIVNIDTAGNGWISMVDQLAYTRGAFLESMRLYPPIPTMARFSCETAYLDTHKLADKSIVFMSLFHMQRHEDFWENPLEFRPERFVGNGLEKNIGYLPFGLGPRSCVGENFANLESLILLVKILKKFKFSISNANAVRAYAGITLHSRKPIMARVFKS